MAAKKAALSSSSSSILSSSSSSPLKIRRITLSDNRGSNMEKILSEPSQQPNNIADVIGNVTTKPKTSTCNTRKHGYSLPSVTSVRSSKTNAESINLSPKMEPRPHNENTSVLLFHLTDLPAWYKDAVNPYILSGYRQATYSYQRCIDSLFFLHNETGNIYSHLFGSLFFIYLMVSLHLQSISSITTLTTGDHLVLSTFLLGCVVCMGLSGGFHLFCCHSHEVSLKWNRVDYIGIVFILFGSLCPIVFYGFFCDPFHQTLYFALISSFGLLTAYIVLTPRCHGARFRGLRSLVFVSQGMCGLLPYAHSSFVHGFDFTRQSLSFTWFVLMAITILSGTAVYNARIPEKWFPGQFDFWINSHQIFHVAVIGAAMLQYQGALASALFWHSRNPSCELSAAEMMQ